MKIAQYTQQEKAIAAADTKGIRGRWLWGLRILNDPEKIAPAGGLKQGVTESLIAAAEKAHLKLSASEIRRRMLCARAYKTEAEIVQVLDDFETWNDLHRANFPTYEAPEGEPPADYRTKAEKEHDLALELADRIGDQLALFPLSEFEPSETTLKELIDYADRQDKITAGFIKTGQKRRAYLGELIDAAEGDLSTTWEDALDRLAEQQEVDEADDDEAAEDDPDDQQV